MRGLSVASLGVFVVAVSGHVRLSFPPARNPRLDFLDNTRTLPHCGLRKPTSQDGNAVRTTLKAGSQINVTWEMAYPHKGGLRIEVLNSRDEPFAVLTPSGPFVGQEDEEQTWWTVSLPTEECLDCGIRLVRQATEWGRYRFWSCADVDIVKEAAEVCSGRGEMVNGRCVCAGPFSGQYCHIQDDCEKDADCGNGVCRDMGAKASPRRVCYCRAGSFGSRCEKSSPLRSRSVDESLYQSRAVGSEGDRVMWRILQGTSEVEIVMKYRTSSWAAVGWRPLNVNPQCAKIPELLQAVQGEGLGYAEPEPANVVPQGAPNLQPQPPSQAEPEPEPKPEISAVPEGFPEYNEYAEYAEYSPEPHPVLPGQNGSLDPRVLDPGNESRVTFDAGFVTAAYSVRPEEEGGDMPSFSGEEASASATPSVAAAPTQHSPTISSSTSPPIITAEVIGDLCYGDWRYPEGCRDCAYRISWAYQEESDEVEFSVETRAPTRWWTGVGISRSGNLSDADVLVVKSVSGVLTLHDMYSTDFQLPSEDLQQDLHTATVVGTHQNGVIRATFSRRRDTGDREHDLAFTDSDDGCYYLLFPVSGGRLGPDGDLRAPKSELVRSARRVCIRPCLTSSEEVSASAAIPLPAQAQVPPSQDSQDPAVTEATNFPDGTCETQYRFPRGCVGEACIYSAEWEYDMEEGHVTFTISSKELGRWTGIGFSRDGNMTNSDIYTGWVSLSGKAYVTDRFAFGRQLPAIDKGRQDVFDVSGKILGDIQTITFKRLAITEDSLTDFPLTDCYHFLFPIGGGRVLARSEADFEDPETAIGFHDRYPPRASKEKICICAPLEEDGAGAGRKRRRRQAASSEPETEPIPSYSFPEPEPEPEPEKQSHHPQPEPHAESEAAAAPSLHPMDCMDVVMGSAIGSEFRLVDAYTISRASPLMDEEYGGSQSLTAAMGWEEDGETTLLFRRKIHSGDAAGDHSIVNGDMLVLWAKGQIPGAYGHSPASALDDATSSYYPLDVPMYHGRHNRGSFVTNFHSESAGVAASAFCHGGYVFPQGCVGAACHYNVSFYRDAAALHINLEAALKPGQWSGIGFSKDGLMKGSDVVMAGVTGDGSVQVTDRFADGYQEPVLDESQDIYSVKAAYAQGRLSAAFSRDLSTGDGRDANLEECHYFVYPVSGGPMSGATALRHSSTPALSSRLICLSACDGGASPPKPSPESEPEPEGEAEGKPHQVHHHHEVEHGHGSHPHPHPHIPAKKPPTDVDAAGIGSSGGSEGGRGRFLMSLRILNEEWREELKRKDSVAHRQLSQRLVSSLDSLLRKNLNGYTKARVVRYKGARGETGTVAEVEVEAPGHRPPQLIDAVQPAIAEGQLEGLEIDAQRITADRISEGGPSPVEIRNWVIIAVAVFLVTAAILFAVCMVLRTKKSKSRDLNGYQGGYAGTYGGATAAAAYPGMAMAPAEAAKDLYGHNRQYSQATTASQAPRPASHSPDTPEKASETTSYGEWYNRVAQQGGAESASPEGRRPRAPTHAPYVSYPNDPYNYYTMGGRNAAAAPPSANPPLHYRPY